MREKILAFLAVVKCATVEEIIATCRVQNVRAWLEALHDEGKVYVFCDHVNGLTNGAVYREE